MYILCSKRWGIKALHAPVCGKVRKMVGYLKRMGEEISKMSGQMKETGK